jgi:hypothetical protein
MEVKVKIGTRTDVLIIATATAAGFALPLTVATVTGEEFSLFFPVINMIADLIISTLIVTAAAGGAVALLRAIIKNIFVLSETTLIVKTSRFVINIIPYGNITSLKTNRYGQIEMTYHLGKKWRGKSKYCFTAEKQDEFYRQLQAHIDNTQTEV